MIFTFETTDAAAAEKLNNILKELKLDSLFKQSANLSIDQLIELRGNEGLTEISEPSSSNSDWEETGIYITPAKEKFDITSVAGIWADDDRTVEDIRDNAWRKPRSL